MKVIQKSSEVPTEYFSYAPPPPRLPWWQGERPQRVVVIRKIGLPWLQQRGTYSPASVRIPRSSTAIPGICAAEHRDKVTPMEGPRYEVRPQPDAARQHVYVRLYKPQFASANQSTALLGSTNEESAFHRLCSETYIKLYKWIYIKKPLLVCDKFLSPHCRNF